jgi:hypothetical protein
MIPMLRAVPSTMKHRSLDVDGVEILHLGLGDLAHLLARHRAHLVAVGLPDPFGTPAARSSRSFAGGVLVTKVKGAVGIDVISTGTVSQPEKLVRALYSLQNCMMFTPCWPSAGPTGGAGLALPAWIC